MIDTVGVCQSKKQNHVPGRQNDTASMAGLKKTKTKKAVTYTKISPKVVNPRDIAVECR